MNIVVLVKQVPAVSDIKIDAKEGNLVRVGAPSKLNPVDLNAIEAALAVKDAVGGTVTIMTMGPATAGEVMRNGIAIGVEKGILITDERMAGSDTLATGKVLAKAIEKIGGADLVFTGKRSTDGDTAQIPPAVAEYLGFSLASNASSVAVADGTVTITRKNNGGLEHVELPLPAVVSVTEEANTPRQARIKGKMAAKKAVFDVFKAEDLGLTADEVGTAGSATDVTKLFAPEPHPTGVMISGDTVADAVAKLVAELHTKNAL